MSKLVDVAISDLKWKASQPFNKGIKGDQIYLSKERALALLAHIERLEALCDLAYSDGAQAGFNLGVTEDNDGLARIIESRKDAVKVLLSKGRKHE